MDVEIVEFIIYLASLGVVLFSGNKKIHAVYIGLGDACFVLLGLFLFNNVTTFHFESFIIFTVIFAFYGVVKVFEALKI